MLSGVEASAEGFLGLLGMTEASSQPIRAIG